MARKAGSESEQSRYFVGHTRFDRWAMGALCLLVVPAFLLPLYIGWGPLEIMLYYYLGMCLIFTIPLRFFLQTLNNLYLYQEGIEIHRPFKPIQFLYWDEIAQIRGSVWSSDLLITDRERTIVCRVNSSYTHHDVLLQLLVFARPDLFQAGQRLTFTISPIPVIILALILGQLSIYGIHGVFANTNGLILLTILAFCLVFFIGVFLFVPYSLTIMEDLLVFHYPFRTIVHRASEIANVQYTRRFDFIYEWGEVTIHENNGNVTVLMYYNLGISLLYAFLNFWHQMCLSPRLEAGDALDTTPVHGHRRLNEKTPYLLPAKINLT